MGERENAEQVVLALLYVLIKSYSFSINTRLDASD